MKLKIHTKFFTDSDCTKCRHKYVYTNWDKVSADRCGIAERLITINSSHFQGSNCKYFEYTSIKPFRKLI